MESNLISDLNTQIAMITPESIQTHLDKGDLADWLSEWRAKTAGIGFELFVETETLTTALVNLAKETAPCEKNTTEDWKNIAEKSERYKGFTILDEPVSLKEFVTGHGDVDLIQIHSTQIVRDNLVGFVGQCRWRNNTLISLDGDTNNENMMVLGYDWFYPMSDEEYSGECLDILVGDDW